MSKVCELDVFEDFPDELKKLKQWVGVRNGSKIPYNIRGAASSSNPDTWLTYENVVKGVDKGVFDLPGFVFCDNDIVGIDIDIGYLDNGFLSSEAVDIIKKLHSYTEKSRSGRGMHIYVHGTLPFDGRNNRQGVEIYKTARYFIVTGQKMFYGDIVENQEGIDYVVEKYFQNTIVTTGGKTKTTTIYQPEYTLTADGSKITFKRDLPEIKAGSRNISLASFAGQLRTQGYPPERIYEELQRLNETRCKPPVDQDELDTIFDSVTRYKR